MFSKSVNASCLKDMRFYIVLLLFGLNITQGFVNSPKIITKDGNLIFEAGLNRNISFRLKGNSRLNINDEYDLLDLVQLTNKGSNSLSSRHDPNVINVSEVVASDLVVAGKRLQELDKRLQSLQNRTRNAGQIMRRSQTRLTRVETKVQSLFDRLELDNCKSNPCENGGNCFNMFNGFLCKCTKNFEGVTCEKDVNECALFAGTDLGCQNGGQCVNQFGGYSCICSPGWFGIHCTQRKGDCMQSSTYELCGHGTCVSSGSDNYGYKCICDQGWKTNGLTPACTMDVDECAADSHPTCATRCINLQGSFTCAPCAPGLTGNGISCRDIDECALQNGGCSLSPLVACINSYGSYHCGECPLGWTGDGRTCVRSSSGTNGQNENAVTATKCVGVFNICHPEATCTEISNTIVCSCPSGMIGSGFGAHGCITATTRNCNSLPCLNGGTCIDSGSSFVCMCPRGFRVPICEPLPSPCSSNPCHNNGQCRRFGFDFKCSCPPGYTGRLCDNRVSRCGGMMVGAVGRIQYPTDGASFYEHNSQCAWVIRTNETQVLNVTFNAFELEDATECRFDWLQLNDGRTAAAQLIGRFCGAHKPFGGNIITTTNHLYLWFRSDNSTTKEGFDLEWNSIPPQCGGVIEIESHGTISTPGSPGKYPKNRDCRWQLRAPNNKRLKLTFFSLQIEKHDSCNFDYVEIRDSISDVELVKYCNTSHPSPLTLPTNDAIIHFHSDNDGDDTGFQIYYSTEDRIPGCGGTFTAKEGYIKSPVISEESISCEYDIIVAPSESIEIRFVVWSMGQDDCVEIYDVDKTQQQTVLQSKHCGGYGYSPSVYNSLYNAMKIKYYSKGGQFELRYNSDCSYTFDSANDTILSPSYPRLGNSDFFCEYKIIAEPNTVLSLSVNDFDLRDSSLGSEDCTYTFLKINDVLEQSVLGPFCGNNSPPTDLVFKTNMVVLSFQSGYTSSGRGFKIEYKTVPMGEHDCGGVYTKPGYSIRLGGDSGYTENMECYWVIVAPVNRGIMLNWKSFKLEYSTDCTYDYVEIYDNLAKADNDKAFHRYCDAYKPPIFISQSRILTIKFVSDFSDSSDGFELTYDFVDTLKSCGGEIFSSTGKLISPEWPENYTNSMDCTWTITSPPGTQIELQFDMFELEEADNCANDWLEVRNGGSANSTLVGYYCGRTIPHTIPSFTNQMRLHFHSDSFVNARGFKIEWHVFSNGCGGNLKSELGVITSPFYPNPYPNNAECEWHVFVHKGSSIHFTVEDLEMEGLFACNYDSLEIFDSRTNDEVPLAKICDRGAANSQFVTTNNEALIRFRTDSSNNERGFLLSYYANCTRTLTDVHGAIESPNFGDAYYKNDVNCTWTIKAPRGNHIAIEFTFMDNLDKNGEIYLIDKQKNGSVTHKILQKQSFNSLGDTLVVIQNSSQISFQLEYSVVGCVQVLHRDSGQFASPNFPKMYPNDLECVWEIKTELGQGIELNIVGLDIEESVNCTKDALQVSNNAHSNNPKERHCGKLDNFITTSSGHHLYVRFYSDGSSNGKGFNATYRTLKSPCGGVFDSKNGVIQSPNYPLNYPQNANCEWTIMVSPRHTITLTIEELELEDYYNCEVDFMEVFSYATDENQETEMSLLKKCGNLDQESLRVTTSTNVAIVRFQTDDSVELKGFKLSFKENCGERITVDENDSDYLEISRNGQTNEICEWQLIAKDPTKHIQFVTTHMQLNPQMADRYLNEDSCITIGAKIYDGATNQSPIRSQFCKTHPPAIISNGNALTIRVPLNVISEFEGFYTTFDNYCGGIYISITGKFSSPYYPSSYPVNIDCEWHILPSPGNSIALTIESMNLEESDECNNDYLEVRETDQSGHMLGVFCGDTVPPTMQGVGLWLKFRSDNDNVGKGFMASYNYVMHNEINGTEGTIQSPKYPTKFHSNNPYSWRITVKREFVVLLTIKHIVDVDIPFVKFYDGYSDIGAQVDYSNTHIVRSNTNILYLTATRGPFELKWEQLSKAALLSNRTAEEKSQVCGKEMLTIDVGQLIFNSPGYPMGYSNNLICNWTIVPSRPEIHAVLRFSKIDVEDYGLSECFADYVTISKSTDLKNWQQLDKLCKVDVTKLKEYHGTPYLMLSFVTDVSNNKTGFSSLIKSDCGSELTDRSSFVNITNLSTATRIFQMECVWTIRVRQGRRIRITFPDSYLQNSNDTSTCRTYFIVRNGIAEDSPFLGKGKYCDNNIDDVLETTSNRAYVKFSRMGFPKFRASFHYEEISHECSDEIILTEETSESRWKTIKSPNYPNLPSPHAECIWKIVAPVHHIISVDFGGHFDLYADTAKTDQCDREYVQLNDGATELMPVLGHYCGSVKPDTKYSSANVLRFKYFSDIPEPHAGFMANVSIGRCGGAWYANEGTINVAPILHALQANEAEIECVYTVEVEKGSTINLTLDKMELPFAGNCTGITHLELQEIDTYGDADNVTEFLRICGTDDRSFIVETNKMIIRYKIKGTPSSSHGFRIRYSAIGSRCGETINAFRGILQTPGYPQGVRRPTHCTWNLNVPKGLRIKIEFLDFDTGALSSTLATISGRLPSFRGRITFANDIEMQSIIARISDNPPAELYSTDNTMTIQAFLLPFSKHRGFKLRFSSEESEYCHHGTEIMSLSNGTTHFNRNNDTAVYCSYDLKINHNETLALHVDRYEKYPGSYTNANICGLISPLKMVFMEQQLLPKLLCNNESQPAVRLPFPTILRLSGNKRNSLRALDLSYQVYKCGGIWPVLFGANITITQPNMGDLFGNGALECAWAVWPNNEFSVDNLDNLDFWIDGVQLEIVLSTDFRKSCDEQYILMYNGPNQNSPQLGRFCQQSSAVSLVVEGGLFFEYYSNAYETQSTFNLTVKQGSGCGGKITYPYREIVFDEQYKNNVECVWELSTISGFHLGVTFANRFFIESSTDCKKDYLKIQEKSRSGDWVDLQTLCGRKPPISVNTTSTEMRLIFRSDADTIGDGFTARFERNCGGVLYANGEVQRLASPGYPISYEHNLMCNWTIVPQDVSEAGVLVSFIDFEVEEPPINTCMFDNVTIITQNVLDGFEEKSVICGVNKKHQFRAKARISVILYTDQSFTAKGFLLEYTSHMCGGLITNSTIIESPRHHNDSNFPANSDCHWNLTAPEGYKIHIKFEVLNFESQMDCLYDSVEVYRGLVPVGDQRVAKLCGDLTGHLPPMMSIPINTGLIRSVSDDANPSRGFKALVSFVPNCDKNFLLLAANSTYQFNTYAGGYSNNVDCTYVFSTTPDSQLFIEFSSFHVEESSNCQDDYLEIRDGAGPFADEIGRFCGHDIPKMVMSSRKSIFMRFVSDGEETSSGFTAEVKSMPLFCGQHNLQINGSQQIILKSAEFARNSNCFWKIKAEKNIHLKFNKIDIKGPNANGSCVGDYIKIYNSEDEGMIDKGYGNEVVFNGHLGRQDYSDFATEHIYCGNVLPDDYFAKSKEVYVKFKTDEDGAKSSFSLTAMAVDGCFRNFTGTQGRILLAETQVFCDIYIKAPQNTSLSLYFSEVTFADYDCNNEYIEVFDVHTNSSLQKSCAYVEPGRSLFTNSNELRMRIKMGGYYTQYDITYLASHNGPGCGGDLYNTVGLITNPFYPNNVRNNSDCRWNIRVPHNVNVLLKFDVFNLGAKSTCHSEYLQIIEHDDDGTERIMAQYCGEDQPRVFKSKRSFVTVRFHKTVNYDGTGWVIRFNGVYANYKIPDYFFY